MSCHIGPNAELEQGAFGDNTHEASKKLTVFPEQGTHRIHNPFIGFAL
jgi:hypothetical protein